jgi:hypothetical protein
LLGAYAGDGTLYKTGWSLVWELRDELTEKEYYANNICPLLREIFNIGIISKFRSGGANGVWGVQTAKKKITSLFMDFGFSPGTKTYTVLVLQCVENSSILVKKAFVRGLFDTDGCLRFDRTNKQKRHRYPRIEFVFASEVDTGYSAKESKTFKKIRLLEGEWLLY